MSTPSSLTDPERVAAGTSSCSRFRIRRNVDFPQPDGPIRAVTWPGSMDSEIRSSTLWEPNQALTLVASKPDGDGLGADARRSLYRDRPDLLLLGGGHGLTSVAAALIAFARRAPSATRAPPTPSAGTMSVAPVVASPVPLPVFPVPLVEAAAALAMPPPWSTSSSSACGSGGGRRVVARGGRGYRSGGHVLRHPTRSPPSGRRPPWSASGEPTLGSPRPTRPPAPRRTGCTGPTSAPWPT